MNPTPNHQSGDMQGISSDIPDESLLAGFLRGEEDMFTELVTRYEQPLYSFICRLTGDPAEATDLFQETFVRVYQRASSFRAESRLKTWLYAVATNVCRAHGRKKARSGTTTAERASEPANGSPGPSRLAESTEVGERIASAVGALPQEQREVFILKVYEEMTFQNISELLERPLGTVKSQMRLALGTLRGDLHDLAEAYDVR